jgi:hypothetical protein
MEKSEENHSTAPLAADWNRWRGQRILGPWGLWRQKEDRKDELMDYVELFFYPWALLQGSKSFPIPLHGNGNKIMMAVHFVWLWCLFGWARRRFFLMEIGSEPSKMKIVLGDEVREKVCWLDSDDVRIESNWRCISNSLFPPIIYLHSLKFSNQIASFLKNTSWLNTVNLAGNLQITWFPNFGIYGCRMWGAPQILISHILS